MSEAPQDLRRGAPRGYDLYVVVTTLPGRTLDRLLEAAFRGEFDFVEAELGRRRKLFKDGTRRARAT